MQAAFFTFLFLAAYSVGIYCILVFGNKRKEQRHQQYWGVPFAILLILVAIYEWYSGFPKEILVDGELVSLAYLLQTTMKSVFFGFAPLVYSLIIVGIYALVKLLVNEGGRLFVKGHNINVVPKFSIAYTTNKKKEVVLRKEWVFPSMYLYYLSWILIVCYFLLVILKVIDNHILDEPELDGLPSLIAFSVLVVLEAYWYLQHPRVEEEETEEQTAVPTKLPPTNLYQLWEEYQQVWYDKLTIAWHYTNKNKQVKAPTTIQVVEAQNLINAGFEISITDYAVLESLNKREDVLIDDLIADKVAPLLFSMLLRRLVDGENILVITAKRCYANSAYHKALVHWINDWIYQLTTNREFFKVQLFSRSEDVEPNAKIIVSSADDILDKNIINHIWFNNLKTILFIQGETIFAESLTANHTLLSILRKRYQHFQSIVLSDYREGIQASVRHNLAVKDNLREVRMQHLPPKSAFTLCWKLEGNSMFQHKVLSGHIEQYLGGEAVLSLLARRERIKDIKMLGQKKQAYHEYLQQLDNNSQSLLEAPVNASDLKYKAVKEVATSEVEFLSAKTESPFLLVQDELYNLVVSLKKWEEYAINNLFLHVLSPPYLLRDYFTDNFEYFSKTPIYPLSTKLMISRYEVARSLLEQMVTQEMSEQEILEDLVWINPKATFVKKELHQLFLLAFGIDIIAANYLSIRSTYEFDANADTFKQVTKYSLLPKIKENISLNFLQNVQITQARNILELTSYDLLFQNYLPDQIHSFNGRPYTIRGYDRINAKLSTNYRSAKRVLQYRSHIAVSLYNLEEALTEAHRRSIGNRVVLEMREGTFDIKTQGYYTFTNDFSLNQNDYRYTLINEQEVPVRHYPLGRVLLLIMRANEEKNVPALSATFCVLLNELMYSLFPETHQYLHIGSPDTNPLLKGEFERLYPQVLIKNDKSEPLPKNLMQLYIVEDAHQDVGMIQSIFDKWDYILRILDDYLHWLLLEEYTSGKEPLNPIGANDDVFRRMELNKSKFLHFGADDYPDFLILEEAKQLLNDILSDNYLSSQRKDFYGL